MRPLMVLAGANLAGLAALAAMDTPPIPMTIPNRYGKTRLAEPMFPAEHNRKQSREYARSQRSKKEYRLKGVRP